jgi:hypothetical protein
VSPDPRSRRELLGFLDAWIGPTSSNLVEKRGRIDRTDPFDAALSALRPDTLLRFEVLPREGAGATQAKLEVRHTLRRIVGSSEIVTWNIGGNDLLRARGKYKQKACGGDDNQKCIREATDSYQHRLPG